MICLQDDTFNEVESHLKVARELMLNTAKKFNNDGKGVIYVEGYIDGIEAVLRIIKSKEL